MNFNQNSNINFFFYSLFHILMIKTSNDQLEKSVNLIAAFDHKYME